MSESTSIFPIPENLKVLICSSETLEVEFKESYSEKTEIREAMISFANAIGGIIFIGVKEVSRKGGIHVGEVIGVDKTGISEASHKVRNWAASLLPRIDHSFQSFLDDGGRIDVITIKESNQKPVCSSAGLYKIRTSDGNTGIDPSRLREIVVGLDSYKSALLDELTNDLTLLQDICRHASQNLPIPNLNELKFATIDAILSNGTLSNFFDIQLLTTIRLLCVQVNKLLGFVISAGGVVIPAQTFYNNIVSTCPYLKRLIEKEIQLLQ